ncbi:MAG: hypothetical protein IJ443_01890 [Firmicutes bacterium]|nr:hypothetical protein [Bacillota bacterium]
MDYLTKDTLYELLDIDVPTDFQYFENLAALLECEDDIDNQVLAQLLDGVDKKILAELLHSYFEEMTDFLPADAAEAYGILERIKLCLMGLARNCEEEELLANLVEEMERFRIWYSVESRVYCTSIVSGEEEILPIRDAVTLARSESLANDKYEYDYSECLDYKLEEYIMNLGDLVAAELEEK